MAIFKEVKTDIDYMFPKGIRDYLSDDHEAWMFNDIIDKIDISDIIIKYLPGGKKANHPRAMIKVIFYSYYHGIYSSRKIAVAMQECIPYKIFSGDQEFNFRRICEFRVGFKEELSKIFTKVLIIAGKFNMINLEALFTDGSFIKANANVRNCYKKEELKKYQEKLRKSIKKGLEKCINEDKEEDKKYGDKINPYLLKEEYRNKSERLEKINEALEELEASGEEEINLTDKDAGKMKQKDGSYKASYNPQIVSTKDQLIMSNDVTKNKNDAGAEKKVEAEAKENIEKLREETNTEIPEEKIPMVKDSGYYRIIDLEEYKKDKDFDYHVPDQNDVSKERKSKKDDDEEQQKAAVYDSEKNVFICIAGQEIGLKKTYKDKKYGSRNVYCDNEKCKGCKLRTECIKGKKDYKEFTILGDLELINEMKEKVKSEKGKELMKSRAQSVEPVYGDIKENNNFRSFLLRGLEKVRLEFSIVCTVHNIKLMINKIRRENINYKEILSIT